MHRSLFSHCSLREDGGEGGLTDQSSDRYEFSQQAVRRLWLFGPAHRSFSEGGRPPDAHLPIHGAIGAALSATSPRSFLAVGFPLLSLADAST
ncbi:MAG: hypothetical protein ACK5TU_10695 [Cyclobacteriaceae bacterium]